MKLLITFLYASVVNLQICLVSGIVGGKKALPPQPDAAVVFVQKFDRNARVEGIKNDARGYYTFLGIRYAEAPTGPRRFQRATTSRLEGEIRATQPCRPCPQPHPTQPGEILGEEDCLCVNIYTPKMPGDEKGSPVLFWVHGGGFRHGSAAYYGGEHLVQKDTILVSVQYRLGSLGFLSNGEKDMSGNAGLFDLSTALQWVLDYVQFFGGDPARVVTIGQGSGGTAASLLALSPLSRSSVRGVAALSGAPLARNAVERSPETHAQRVARHTNCPAQPPERLLACLRKLPLERIIKTDSKVQMDTVDAEGFLSEVAGNLGSGAAVEGVEDERALPPLVSEAPADVVARGEQRVPLLTGVVRDETARAVFGQYSNTLRQNLEKIPDYIRKQIVAPLRRLLPMLLPVTELGNAVPLETAKLLSLDTYYALLDSSGKNLTQGLVKIVEATGDALFNFPAFLSVERWGEAAPAYLYSFEHSGNRTKGRHFLAGLPIVGDVSSERSDDFIAHGDELAYLFEPLDVDGKPAAGGAGGAGSGAAAAVSAADERVRDHFTGLIARFAHNLTVADGARSNQYLQIGKDIKLTDNFRFCQMGLWGNIQSRLQDTACTLLAQLLTTDLAAAKDKLTGALKPLSSAAGLGGLLGTAKANPAEDAASFNNILNPLGAGKIVPKPGKLKLTGFGF